MFENNFFKLEHSVKCWRRGWLASAIPVMLKGIAGPGAPHVMHFVRRINAGCCSAMYSMSILFDQLLLDRNPY